MYFCFNVRVELHKCGAHFKILFNCSLTVRNLQLQYDEYSWG